MTRINSWILNYAKTGDLRITKLTWPQELGLDFHEYKVQYQNLFGTGTDRDEDTALIKACSELFERHCVQSCQIENSNGCASHSDLDSAVENAQNELIERDSFLFCFLTQSFSQDMLLSSRALGATLDQMSNYLIADQNVKVVMSLVKFNQAGFIVGLGTANQLNQAIEKAEIEALRQWFYYKDMINQIEVWNQKSFDRHGDLALLNDFSSQMFKCELRNEIDYATLNFKIKRYLNPDDSIFKDCPFVFVQAQHESLIPLVTGPYSTDILKATRLNFMNWNQDPSWLHPLR